MSQFTNTRNLYLESVKDFEFPLTYETWLAADDEYKAVLLFVNFFNEIELAWYKTKFSFVVEEDAVSQVNTYLIKNVDLIKADGKRFKPSYIYTVAANCLRSLTYIERDINREKYESCNEVVSANGDIVDLYDLVPCQDDPIEVAQAKEAIWDIIAKMGPKAEKVANKLLNPDDSLRARRTKCNADDRLRDVDVKDNEFVAIVEQFRNDPLLLKNFQMIIE